MYYLKTKTFAKSLLAAGLLSTGIAANAAVIDFDNDLPTVGGLSSWSQEGYTVASNQPSGTLVDNNNLVRTYIGAPGTGNNTQSIFFGANGSTSTLTVTQDQGYGFDLTSFDASSLYNAAGTLTVTGYTATSGIVTQNFVLGSSIGTINVTGMDALNTLVFSFDGTTEFAPYDLDNITLTLVPIPAAVWLMGSALGLLFVGRRKKA